MSVDTLLSRFSAGERGALARLLTYIENGSPLADEALESLYSQTGRARVIGVTGPPGAGKSTLTNALIGAFRGRELTVGVLAVDPSSSISGGAALGDRIRMLETHDDEGVFIRSMATRGQIGGLALATGRATHALDAFGFDVIILETVGVGQDEVDIATSADTTLLLQVPGLGDSVQTIKAGILEIADIIVVNKADLPEAKTLARDLKAMLRYRAESDWTPPVISTVSSTAEGIDGLIAEIDHHTEYLARSGEGQRRLVERARNEILRLSQRKLDAELDSALKSDSGQTLVDDVRRKHTSPGAAAQKMVDRVLRQDSCHSDVEHGG